MCLVILFVCLGIVRNLSLFSFHFWSELAQNDFLQREYQHTQFTQFACCRKGKMGIQRLFWILLKITGLKVTKSVRSKDKDSHVAPKSFLLFRLWHAHLLSSLVEWSITGNPFAHSEKNPLRIFSSILVKATGKHMAEGF